jgi:hypothetical protein
MTVTGRTYSKTRSRGFTVWRPQQKSLVLLAAVLAVIEEYDRYLPLTLRQIFYRLCGLEVIDKSDKAYDRLGDLVVRARRARRISFNVIRDDGGSAVEPNVWDSPHEWVVATQDQARRFRHDPALWADRAIELWIESEGMVPQGVRVADPYGVPVFSAGGFDSLSAKWGVVKRIISRPTPTTILHVGDYDPSGCSVIDSAADDILTFLDQLGHGDGATFVRSAVTLGQVHDLGLPTQPQKSADKRGEHMEETVQAEAIAPDVLAEIIEAALLEHVDLAAVRRARDADAAVRDWFPDRFDEALGPLLDDLTLEGRDDEGDEEEP